MTFFKEDMFDNRGGVGEANAIQIIYHGGIEHHVSPQVAYTMINTDLINNIARICWDSIQGHRVSGGIWYAIDHDPLYNDFFIEFFGPLYNSSQNYIVIQNLSIPPQDAEESQLEYLHRSTIAIHQLDMFS